MTDLKKNHKSKIKDSYQPEVKAAMSSEGALRSLKTALNNSFSGSSQEERLAYSKRNAENNLKERMKRVLDNLHTFPNNE